jgi:hypothetical protein
VTEASRRKADIEEEEAEARKDKEIDYGILASGGKQAILARLHERRFRIHTWQRVFPSKKQRSS